MTPTGAILSPCRRYRYYLQRTWDEAKPRLCWIMLNPSMADEIANDATIRICMGRATLEGYGGIDVVNLFALRSTDPSALYDLFQNPISEPEQPGLNDEVIRRVALKAKDVICAWGTHGNHLERGRIIRDRLTIWGAVPTALKINKDGTPAHPLRIPYSTKPIPY